MTGYIIIAIVALIGSGLTLFSGFGLGTILLPVFGVFFPIEIAVALTGIVHFLNNIFKFFLIGKSADKKVLLKFGIPSVMASFAGAVLLDRLSHLRPLLKYHLLGNEIEVLPLKFIIAMLLLFFALYEFIPKLRALQFDEKYLALGGLLSGFFGGLSGNQGVLRSAFLIRAKLSKESYIATGVVLACFIDITRLSVYFNRFSNVKNKIDLSLLIIASLAAFIGAFIGNKLMKKVTLHSIQVLVSILIIIFSILLAFGII
jgi:uncharacterized membrane protein YfcA